MSLNEQSLNAIRDIVARELDPVKINIQKLVHDVATLKAYNKLESSIQEEKEGLKLLKLLQDENTGQYVQQLDWKSVWRRNGTELTDLDGCFVVRPYTNQNLESMRRATAQTYSIPYTPSVTNTTVPNQSLVKPPRLVIMEAKHQLEKVKIDEKLLALSGPFVRNVLYATIARGDNDLFKRQQREYVSWVPKKVVLYFTTEYVSSYSVRYVNMIKDGSFVDEQTYNDFVLQMVRHSTHYEKIFKKRRQPFTSLQQLRDTIHNIAEPENGHLQYLLKFIRPYRDLKAAFDFFENAVYLMSSKTGEMQLRPLVV